MIDYHLLPDEGRRLESAADIDSLLSEAFSVGADWLAVPTARLGRDFFDLSTRLLGETAQKFANYNVGLAIVGDIADHAEKSAAFRDFVRETNEGGAFWFIADEQTLASRMGERV